MGEHDHHRQHMYERFLAEDCCFDTFAPHNVMEMLLFLARPRIDTNALAHTLIKEFGSFSRAIDAPYEELAAVPGVGPSTATALKLIPAFAQFYLEDKVRDVVQLASPAQVEALLRPRFFAKTEELLYAAYVDDRKMLLRCSQISTGNSSATALNAQKIVYGALGCGATGVYLAHNHPRGLATPSGGDLAATGHIRQALEHMEIQLLDHLIFTEDDVLFFSQSAYRSHLSPQRRSEV